MIRSCGFKFPPYQLTLLTVLGCILCNSLTMGDDWPHWNGKNRDGISAEKGILRSWPPEGLTAEWSCEIGTGFSSMAIVDGRVYAMGHLDGEEIVWCLNASDGQVLWTHRYKSQLLPNLHEGGPCSTPTVDGDFVYTIGKEGQFYCLHKTDGTIQWHVELQKELDVKVPEWGFSSSPLILNNQVLLEGGRIVSFNKRNGQKLWQSDRHAAGYGSVATFEYDGQILLASLDCDGLRVSSSETGEELAFAEWKSPYETNSTTPIIQGNQIFISTGYDVGCGLFEFDGKSLKRIYSNKNMRNHFNNSVLLDGWIYGIDGNSHNGRNATLNCIQFSTGELAWKQRGLGCGSLIAADGKLIVLSEKGALVLAEQSEKGFTELARSELLSGRCWTAPALANGYLFARNAGGTLKCVKLPGEQQSSD